MIIKCTEKEKELILRRTTLRDLTENSSCNTTDCEHGCEKCFEDHNIKFEIVEDKENE